MPERPVWMQPNASASAFTRVIDALWGYTAGLQTQNRENNPMQRKGPAPSTRAACVGAREEKWSVVHRPAQSHPTLARDLRKVGLAALCKRRKCLARLATGSTGGAPVLQEPCDPSSPLQQWKVQVKL